MVFSCLIYIVGLYAPLRMEHAKGKRFGRLASCLIFSLAVVVAVGYIDWSSRVGRGVMFYATAFAGVLTFFHHLLIYRRSQHFRERVVFIVNDRFDEAEARAFASFGSHLDFVGLVAGSSYEPGENPKVLGKISDIETIVAEHRVKRVLCTTTGMDDPQMRRAFCQLRYSGITVVSLVSLCEEVYQFVPLEFVSPSWLLGASDSPQMLYIKKIKRAFDILASSVGLIFLGPIMLLGMLAVKLGSEGPVFYRQTSAWGASASRLKSSSCARWWSMLRTATGRNGRRRAMTRAPPAVGRFLAPLPGGRDPAIDQRLPRGDVLRGTAPGTARVHRAAWRPRRSRIFQETPPRAARH